MKFNILQKLFTVSVLPTFVLVLLSYLYINNEYKQLSYQGTKVSHLTVLKKASSLIHTLQLERGISLYLYTKDSTQYEKKLSLQKKLTDKQINDYFNAIERAKHLPVTLQKHLNIFQQNMETINEVRAQSKHKNISSDNVFKYYTSLNEQLIYIINTIKFHTQIDSINTSMYAFYKTIQYQEYAGQERALVAAMALKKSTTSQEVLRFNYLLTLQKEKKSEISFILKESAFARAFSVFQKRYATNDFDMFRKRVIHFEQQKNKIKNKLTSETSKLDKKAITALVKELHNLRLDINPNDWFEVSSQRINKLHTLENKLFTLAANNIQTNIEKTKVAIRNQMLSIILLIVALLVLTYFMAHKIKFSITRLEEGVENFFDFIDYKAEKPNTIDTSSNDELNDMAQKINTKVKDIEQHFDKDVDFINEITQIVKLMQDGNFSERPYFEPHNPHLIELKDVFNELTDLIAQKIKEQTDSLSELNASLEQRVHFQTLELEEQIKEITISRDKAIQAEIAKDEFLANMSHEIRTPLNAILGFVTILKKTTKEEKSLHYLSIIDTSGQSLLAIINDILDFSKIQSGKFTITPYQVNIVEEMSNAALLFASKAYEKHLLYAVYINPNMPEVISLDSIRVKQIFSNMLSNAIKFTPDDGSIEVDIDCIDSVLHMSIKDSGIGIAPEYLSRIFSAFEQADGSTTRKYGGTGLGLSISYKLSQLMGGELSVESEKNKGSTFTLKLPVDVISHKPKQLINPELFKDKTIAILDNNVKENKKGLIKKYLEDFGITNIQHLTHHQNDGYDLLFFTPDDDYNASIVYNKKPTIALLRTSSIKLANLEHIHPLYIPYTPSSIVESIHNSGIEQIPKKEVPTIEYDEETQFIGSILVAEDNKTNQMLISLLLEDYGLDFTIVKDGLEAVEMFKKEKFDLVLMDENMPELNGIGAMQQIKAYEKDNALETTPIVALTASVLETDKKKFMDAGMDGFVGKPIENKELESELARFLKKKD